MNFTTKFPKIVNKSPKIPKIVEKKFSYLQKDSFLAVPKVSKFSRGHRVLSYL